MDRKLLLQIFLLLFCISQGSAQEFSYRHYSIPDGLVQSQVTCLFQDSHGYLWIATKGGVSRFDGIEFKNFSRSDGFFKTIVDQIIETDDGYIWFCSNSGFTCWNGQTMTDYPTPLIKNPFNLHVSWQSGRNELTTFLLYYQSDIEVLKFANGHYSKKTFDFKSQNIAGNPFAQYTVLYDRHWKRVLLSTEQEGLQILRDNKIIPFPGNTSAIQHINSDRDGNIYAWMNNKLFRVEEDHITYILDPGGIVNPEITHVIQNQSGIFYLQNQVGRIAEFGHGQMIQDHFRFPIITCLYIDRNNSLWIGTEAGLYHLLSRAFINFVPATTGILPCVWSIAEDRKKNIWFASFSDGLAYYDGRNFKKIHEYEDMVRFKQYSLYMGSIVDHKGNILLTDNQHGGIRFDGKYFSQLFTTSGERACFFLYEDTTNNCLLAGTTKGLLLRSAPGKEKLLGVHPGGKNSSNIICINKDKLGRYWLGGFHGISLYDHGEVIQLPSKKIPFDKGGNTMTTDKLENIWIGNEEGLFLYDFKAIHKINHPFLHTFITALTLVGDTGLLIGSVSGLDWLDLKAYYSGKIKLRHFDRNNGFQGIEVGQNGFFRDSKGYYWIPTSDRVVRFDPRQIKQNGSLPAIFIKTIEVLSERMKWEELPGSIEPGNVIRLNHNQKNVRFSFIGINQSDPEKVKYQYKLAGYDEGWSQPDNSRSVVYTNLPLGNYTFLVKACNEDGIWNEEPASLKFRVVPAFWQAWWFWVLLFILGSGSFLFLGYTITIRKKRMQQEKLEQEKKLAELQLISMKNQIDPHFTFNAMNAIASVVLKEDKEMAYRFFMKLSALIRSILVSGDKLTRTLGEELTFVTNYLEVEKFRFKEKFEYTLDFNGQLESEEEVPKMVVQTYVENAIKHGLMHKEGTGHLWVQVFPEQEGLRILITDDGIGREKAKEYSIHSTGKGLVILNGYYEYFRTFKKKNILHEITDLLDAGGNASGTKVEIFIPKNH